ncbi:MAG: hypothetical protein QGI63_11680 [Rhodospirillales bacterium]|jgi:septal ring factor EnvC (AmiA/AmiB activator)|nr:hypothetical protein [Rhodospirillales bacterium]
MAAMSLIVAFAALWLASDARKSVDGLTDEFVNTHIRAVRNKIAENNRKINDLASQLSRLAKALKADEAGRAESEKSFSAINAELQKLRDELDQLDQSIPPRYRLRVHAEQSR